MRTEIREWIDAYARNLLKTGRAKTMQKALALGDEATRCGARTRKGTPCRFRGLGRGGRCKLHGGASTGPKTIEGKARSLAAARAGFQRWKAAQNGQTVAPPPRASAPRRIDVRDWPTGDGCRFELKWPDGFEVQVQITRNTAVLTADTWEETFGLKPDGKRFVCNGCERPTPTLWESEQFLCEKCIAYHEEK